MEVHYCLTELACKNALPDVTRKGILIVSHSYICPTELLSNPFIYTHSYENLCICYAVCGYCAKFKSPITCNAQVATVRTSELV